LCDTVHVRRSNPRALSLLTVNAGFTQTINDWYDKEIDAINEPYRPIPSGAISEGEVIAQIWILLLGGLGIAYGLDVWAGHDFPTVLALSVFGSFISYIYSAPPLKLKQNGWAGNFALGEWLVALCCLTQLVSFDAFILIRIRSPDCG
jgi:4-hydroxybenzoate polyprenyltransferase